MLDSVWGRAPAQHSTTPPRACDGQSQADSPKNGVHRNSGAAAGMPSYDRHPLDHLLKLWDKAALMQRPRLAEAGCPFRPLRACKHGETKWLGKKQRVGSAQRLEHRGREVKREACGRTGSVHKRLELPQCAFSKRGSQPSAKADVLELEKQGHGSRWSYPNNADDPRAKTSGLKAS